jgi:Tfp pilus assembly protein PilX
MVGQTNIERKAMATLNDLYAAWRRVYFLMSLNERTSSTYRERQKLLEAAQAAVMADLGISDPSKAPNLPGETELGEKASAALEALTMNADSGLV